MWSRQNLSGSDRQNASCIFPQPFYVRSRFGSRKPPMAVTEADFWITRRVCETLHGMARGRDEAECLLDMLVTAGHCPRFGPRQRATLYRLADLLAISWTNYWEHCMESESCNRDCFRVKCYVPEQDESIWDNVAGAAAVNAAMFGTAATTLRYLQTLLPHDGHHLRTESWLHIGQECLSTCAQLLRQTMPCAHMGTASGAKGGDG